MRRHIDLVAICLAPLAVLLVTACAYAAAQEAASDVAPGETLADLALSPLGRVAAAALVMLALEALKAWRAFADAALDHPLARAAMALVLAVVAALPAWIAGASLGDAATLVATNWIGAMGLNAAAGAAANPRRDDLPPRGMP